MSLRYFNVAGAHGRFGERHAVETHLIPIVLQVAAGQRESVQVFGDDWPTPDGTCVRDYIHVDDLAEAHLLALQHARPGRHSVYNLGIGTGFSVREVLEAARAVTGHPIPAITAPRRDGDPAVLIASSEAARTELGWSPAAHRAGHHGRRRLAVQPEPAAGLTGAGGELTHRAPPPRLPRRPAARRRR